MSAPTPDQVRRFVGLTVASGFSSCPFEYLSHGAAANVSRRINRMLSESPEFAALLNRAAAEIAKELPAPFANDVPGSLVAFAQGRAR